MMRPGKWSSAVFGFRITPDTLSSIGLQLLTVGPVVDPFTRRRDPLAGGNGWRMPNDGHEITVPARFGTQNAEAIVDIVVSDALDDAGQEFQG